MPRAAKWVFDTREIRWAIFCPGCRCYHAMHVQGGKPTSPKWTFNGDVNYPTFHPSVLCRWEYPVASQKPPKICHSWIRAGRITFLDDSTHELAGQTVDLPEVEDDE
jgi:hypothetical protein